ncbi:MAG: thioredoxin domain-containing protein [Saccharothrix sp.]|nr:thioredoxin domain-containing protein [Saccharothrix sp.]
MDENRKRPSRAVDMVGRTRRARDRHVLVIGVTVVTLLALAIVAGVLLTRSARDDELTAPPGASGIDAPVRRTGGVVVVGSDTAPTTIAVYEDFLCPACARFEEEYGPRIGREVETGRLRVEYHLLPMLVGLSHPEGYSLDAANAALCAADQDRFWAYHQALFAVQPREGGAGHSEQELVDLGRDLGITDPGFEPCVRTGAHDDAARAELAHVVGADFFHGTPTVTVSGKRVDLREGWLNGLLGDTAGSPSAGS